MLTANIFDIVADYRQRKNYGAGAFDFWVSLWLFWYPNLPKE